MTFNNWLKDSVKNYVERVDRQIAEQAKEPLLRVVTKPNPFLFIILVCTPEYPIPKVTINVPTIEYVKQVTGRGEADELIAALTSAYIEVTPASGIDSIPMLPASEMWIVPAAYSNWQGVTEVEVRSVLTGEGVGKRVYRNTMFDTRLAALQFAIKNATAAIATHVKKGASGTLLSEDFRRLCEWLAYWEALNKCYKSSKTPKQVMQEAKQKRILDNFEANVTTSVKMLSKYMK